MCWKPLYVVIFAMMVSLTISAESNVKGCRGTRPVSCSCQAEFNLLCGSDGRTYGNFCYFNCAKMCDPVLLKQLIT
ncbi:unnamed protein product [Allacma fusca]|uniref:Kazal-like domain-containing protein n=1 Tax=Allacma fusca TaxID=39272 RepID=A0A8J2KCC0_9HEXA|nr:unnamed protein product [Allacma fusca]